MLNSNIKNFIDFIIGCEDFDPFWLSFLVHLHMENMEKLLSFSIN